MNKAIIPNDLDLEYSIIASALTDPFDGAIVCNQIPEAVFYNKKARIIRFAIGRVIESGSDSTDLLSIKAAILDQQGSTCDISISDLMEIIEKFPRCVDLQGGIDRTKKLFEARTAQKAAAELQKRIEQDPQNVESHLSSFISSVNTKQGTENTPNNKFSLVPIRDMELRSISWTIKGFLEEDSLNVLFGDPGSFKSFLAVAWLCCVSSGRDFMGRSVRQGIGIMIAGEGQNGLARRFRAAAIRMGVKLEDLPLFISTVPTGLCDEEQAQTVIDAIKDVAEKHGAPVMIVIDTLARNFGPGDENSTHDMTTFIAACDRIRGLYRSTVLLVHHTGHMEKGRARGSMALKGSLDAEYRVDRDDSGIIRLENLKMKDAEKPESMAFRPAIVELGEFNGEVVTSVVLDPTNYEPPAKKGNATRGRNQVTALEVLRDLFKKHEKNLMNGGFNSGSARVSMDDWRDECSKQGIEDRRTFFKVKESLLKQGVISIFHGFVEIQ